MTHERRLSALGPGGLNRKRAGFEVRDVHISHYGRICPIETPEGTNIGLIASLAIYADVDEYGFLLTPYRVVEGRPASPASIKYLRADEEMKAILRAARRRSTRRARSRRASILARVHGDLADGHEQGNSVRRHLARSRSVSVSAALIPFLEHDDANRALMGSNMQRQAVPLLQDRPAGHRDGHGTSGRPEHAAWWCSAERAGAVTYCRRRAAS